MPRCCDKPRIVIDQKSWRLRVHSSGKAVRAADAICLECGENIIATRIGALDDVKIDEPMRGLNENGDGIYE